MRAPKVPDHGPKGMLAFARAAMDYVKTIRPVAGVGIRVSEIKGGGTLISIGNENGGGDLIVTLCQNGELRRYSMVGADLGPVE